MLELHARVRREAQEALDDVRDWGSVDFGHACEQVLEMEDSPEKARCLARLGGFALWYAHNLCTEEEPRCNISAAEDLMPRLADAAGCPDEESGTRIVDRVKALHDVVLGTHRVVTPAEGGPDMCGDCGVDIEDAIGEAVLCPAHGKREAVNELIELRAQLDRCRARCPNHPDVLLLPFEGCAVCANST